MKKKMTMKEVHDGFERVLRVSEVDKSVPIRDEKGEIVRYDDGFGLVLSDGGEKIPYVFVVSQDFALDANGEAVLPVQFRVDENLRRALEILRVGESMHENAEQLLNDEEVAFLFANYQARRWKRTGILVLDDSRYAANVVVRIKGKQSLELAAFYGAESFVVVRDGSDDYSTYMILSLKKEDMKIVRRDEPVDGVWYGDEEEMREVVLNRLEDALNGHHELICAEENKMDLDSNNL